VSKLIYGKVQKMTCILFVVIAFLFCQRVPALASSVDTVQVSSAPMARATITKNGMVRVYLSSLENPSVLNVTVKGNYSLSTNNEFLAYGTQVRVNFSASSGQISVTYNGKTVNAGQKATLRRHQANGENGLLIAQSYENQNLYPGDLSFEAVAGETGYTLYTVAHIYIENYLYGVLPYEMSNSAGMEALKAQAVAARTYTVRMMQQRSAGRYDVKDTTSDQVYRGTPKGNANCVAAVDATKGIVLMSGSNYVTTFYSASNGGQTEISRSGTRYSYMKMKDDPFDYANPNSSVKRKMLYANLQSTSNPSALISVLKSNAVAQLQRNGYPATFDNTTLQTLTSVEPHTPMYESPSRLYTKMDFSFTAAARNSAGQTVTVPLTVTLDIFSDLESLLGMSFQTSRNELWSVEKGNGTFSLQVRRYGHGMGMSQRGAMYMAQLGYAYDEILGFYFEGCNRVQHNFSSTVLGSSGSEQETTIQPPADLDQSITNGCTGTVNLSNGKHLYVLAADHSNAAVIGIVPDGAKVEVLTDLNEWSQIRYGDIVGYVRSNSLLIHGTPANEKLQVSSALGFVTVTCNDFLNLRQSGSTNARIVGTAPAGTVLTVFSKNGSWAKVQYHTTVAYVNTGYVSAIYSLSDPEGSASGETAFVTTRSGTGTVNLRQSNSLNSRIIAQLSAGTAVTVVSDDGEWSSVISSAGRGYMMSSFLRYSNDDSEEDNEQNTLFATVATQQGSLNMRIQPNAGSRILTTIPKGVRIEVIEKADDWCAVRYDGCKGYVMSAFLSFADNDSPQVPETPELDQQWARVVTASGSLNLRRYPSANAQILKLIPRNTVLSVAERGAQWCLVEYQGHRGYVMTSFLLFETDRSDDEVEDSNDSVLQCTAYVSTQSGMLNLRKLPSLTSIVLTAIPQRAAVVVSDYGEEWCAVQYGGYQGYVMTEYLAFENVSSDSSSYQTMWVVTQSGSLNMRQTASLNSQILTTIPRNKQVRVLTASSEWSFVEYGVYKGYVMTAFLSEHKPEENAEMIPEYMPVQRASVYTVDAAPIYEQPNFSNESLLEVPAGVEVELLLEGEEWCCITYQGTTGYCLATKLNVSYE